MKTSRTRQITLAFSAILILGVLGLYGSCLAVAPPAQAQLPFRNAVDQREQMIRELQEIKALLREQNALLQQVVQKNSRP